MRTSWFGSCSLSSSLHRHIPHPAQNPHPPVARMCVGIAQHVRSESRLTMASYLLNIWTGDTPRPFIPCIRCLVFYCSESLISRRAWRTIKYYAGAPTPISSQVRSDYFHKSPLRLSFFFVDASIAGGNPRIIRNIFLNITITRRIL